MLKSIPGFAWSLHIPAAHADTALHLITSLNCGIQRARNRWQPPNAIAIQDFSARHAPASVWICTIGFKLLQVPQLWRRDLSEAVPESDRATNPEVASPFLRLRHKSRRYSQMGCLRAPKLACAPEHQTCLRLQAGRHTCASFSELHQPGLRETSLTNDPRPVEQEIQAPTFRSLCSATNTSGQEVAQTPGPTPQKNIRFLLDSRHD